MFLFLSDWIIQYGARLVADPGGTHDKAKLDQRV